MRTPALPLAATIVALGLSLPGCERRVVQCNRLIDAINQEQPKLAKAVRQGPAEEPTPEALENFGAALDALIKKIKGLPLKDKKLVGYRDNYAALLVGLANAARRTAQNFEDHKEAQKAADELNAFRPKERALVKEINDYCQGRGG